MNEFVASNGVRIRGRKAEGWTPLEWNLPSDDRVWRLVGESTDRVGTASGFSLDSRLADAFREFFLAERDAELGRWRSKGHPEYVVSSDGSLSWCRILNERTLSSEDFARSFVDEQRIDWHADVAREFFAAHPEPKPWHDAEPGEVWELTYGGQPTAHVYTHRTIEPGFAFLSDRAIVSADDPDITAGRRIWPEVSA